MAVPSAPINSMSLPPDASVLLIRLSAMGDILFSLETLASLKSERPDARVDFVVEDRFAALLAGHPQIDNLLVFPRRHAWAHPAALWRLRRRRYDLVLDLHGNLKSASHALLARGAAKLGYDRPIAREGAQRLYKTSVALPTPRPHRADQGYYLLRAAGLRGAPAQARLAVDAEHHADVILHPGTSDFARFKRWPAERYGQLAERLTARGISVAATLGPGEVELGERLRNTAPSIPLIEGGARGLLATAAVYAGARVVVAADTGPLHLAAATGTRVVALFGPKNPDLYGPRGTGHHVLFHDVPCRPCRLRACDSPQCVLGISTDQVEAAVFEVLDSPDERT